MVKNMKNWIEKHLTSDEINRISDLVSAAEKDTDGEIVPIIVRRSSSVGHVKWLLTLLMTLIFLIFENLYIQKFWNQYDFILQPLAFLLFYLLSHYLQNISWLQRVLTPNEDEIIQVYARAELEFYRKQMKNTARRTGILIFVSVMERRVVVLADEGISAHYSSETWDEIVHLLTAEFRNGNICLGFEKAIKRCGEILRAKLPATHKNSDELTNHLIIKD